MPDSNDKVKSINGNKQNQYEGYIPFEKGYQPTHGELDTTHPPKGGSGVPPKNHESQADKK